MGWKKSSLSFIAFVFAGIMVLTVLPARAAEQNTIISPEELLWRDVPSVTVVSKSEQSYRDVPMSVYVITREDMQRWGVRNLYETMQRVPGFGFYNTDYYGQYGVMARGSQSVWRYGSSIELMPLIDFGHWVFEPNFFKSIEVARGPAGLMWGSNAEAGSMNFNIRDDLRGLETGVQYGNVGRRAVDVMYGDSLNTGNAGDSLFLGWHYEHQGFNTQIADNFYASKSVQTDWKENGINDSQSFLGKVQYKDVKATVFYDQPDWIAPRLWFGNSSPLEAALNNLQGTIHDTMPVLALRGEYHVPEERTAPLNTKLYFYTNYYKKQWYVEGVAIDTQKNQSFGFNAETTVRKNSWKLVYGGDLWGEDSTTDPSFTSLWADNNYGINWYDNSLTPAKRQYSNLYFQTENKLTEKLTGILGARVDWQKSGAPETIWSGPRAALIYSPRENLTLKYLHNMGVRRPQANEITGSSPAAEKMVSDELVIMGNLGDKLQGSLSLYAQTLDNKITRIENGSLNSFENTGGLYSKGLEWDLKYNPIKKMLVYYNGSYINKCEVIISNPLDPELHDNQMRSLFVPMFSHFVGTEYDFGLLKANADLRYITNIPYQQMDLSYGEKNALFFDLTFRTTKSYNDKTQLALNCLNIFDQQGQVPAFGEHSGNGRGTLAPEGRRVYASLTVDLW
jgi:outer membrane receptor protein involved in Fe transport